MSEPPTRTPAILSAPPIINPNYRGRGGSYSNNNSYTRGGEGGGGGGGGVYGGRRYSNGSNGSYDNRRPSFDDNNRINYDDDSRGYNRSNPSEWDDRKGSGGGGGGGGIGGSRDGGRGYNRRSRSPSYDERRSKRQRSNSPRRGSYSGNGGKRSDYRNERDEVGSRNQRSNNPDALQPPESLPYLVTFRYFTDYTQQQIQSGIEILPDSLNDAWKRYQIQFLRQQNHNFWNEQKDKSWFKERYEPSDVMESLRQSSKKKGLEGAVDSWLEAMESGKIDVGLDQSAINEVTKALGSDAIAVELSESTLKLLARYNPKHQGNSIILPANPNQLFIESFSFNIPRLSLEEHCQKVPGFSHLAISEPVGWKNFSRVAWATFNSPEEADAALPLLNCTPFGNHSVRMTKTTTQTSSKRLTPGSMNEADRIALDLMNIMMVVTSFEKTSGDSRGSTWIAADHNRRSEELESDEVVSVEEAEASAETKKIKVNTVLKKTLDLYIHYLRYVFYTCYYCVCTFDHSEELNQRCARHERKPLGTVDEPLIRVESAAFLKNLDEKIVLLSNVENVDPREFGGDSYDEELHRICEPSIKHEDEGKLRCKECNKLFSALKFIEKHISSKHPEALGDSLVRLKYFNNYVLDPAHLTLADKETPSKSLRNLPPLRDYRNPSDAGPEGMNRSLSDRIGGRIENDISGNKFQKSKNGGGSGGGGRNNLAPPPGMALDPRATGGRFSAATYADLDGAPSGEADVVLLPY